MRRQSMTFGAVGLVIGLAVGAAGMGLVAADESESGDVTERTTTTVPVERRTLELSESTTGELASSAEADLTTIGSGTITSAAEVGAQLDRGSQIVRVDDRPVVLLIGDQPVWRSFEPDMTDGPDVTQLEWNLAALGFTPAGMVLDDHYSDDTANAIEAWEDSLGIAEPDGVIDEGQVIFATGLLQVVTSVPSGTRLSPGDALATVRPDDGSALDLTFSVTEEADRYQPEQAVNILAADGTSTSATIVSFERDAAESGQGAAGGGDAQAAASFTVTAAPKGDGDGLTPGQVDVEIPTESAIDTLAVPSRALVAVVEGDQAVELAEGNRLVPVEIGVFAEGWVEISGDGIDEGTMVVVPT